MNIYMIEWAPVPIDRMNANPCKRKYFQDYAEAQQFMTKVKDAYALVAEFSERELIRWETIEVVERKEREANK